MEIDNESLKIWGDWYKNEYEKKLESEDTIRRLAEQAVQKVEWIEKQMVRLQLQSDTGTRS